MSVQGNVHRAQFKVHAATDAECGGLEYVEATSNRTVTPDQAMAIAAQFPKSVGLRVHRFIGRRGAKEMAEVVFHAYLCPNKPNRGVNEGGFKRYCSFLKHAKRLGHEVHYDPGHLHASPEIIPSEDDFESWLWTLLLFPATG